MLKRASLLGPSFQRVAALRAPFAVCSAKCLVITHGLCRRHGGELNDLSLVSQRQAPLPKGDDLVGPTWWAMHYKLG